MNGIQVRWPRRPWNKASPSNPAIRKYSIEMFADIHTEVRRCTVMLYSHPLTNIQGYASLQCAYPQPTQCCISWSLDWKGRPYSMACEVTWPESPSLFLWKYLNSLVFETPVETVMELVARIVAVYDIILATNFMPVSTVFPGRWIGRRSPIPWPAKSPDLNFLHYFYGNI